MYIEIQSCVQAIYSAREIFLQFKSFKVENTFKWLTLYSLTKTTYNRCLLMYKFIYQKQNNLYKFNKQDW